MSNDLAAPTHSPCNPRRSRQLWLGLRPGGLRLRPGRFSAARHSPRAACSVEGHARAALAAAFRPGGCFGGGLVPPRLLRSTSRNRAPRHRQHTRNGINVFAVVLQFPCVRAPCASACQRFLLPQALPRAARPVRGSDRTAPDLGVRLRPVLGAKLPGGWPPRRGPPRDPLEGAGRSAPGWARPPAPPQVPQVPGLRGGGRPADPYAGCHRPRSAACPPGCRGQDRGLPSAETAIEPVPPPHSPSRRQGGYSPHAVALAGALRRA